MGVPVKLYATCRKLLQMCCAFHLSCPLWRHSTRHLLCRSGACFVQLFLFLVRQQDHMCRAGPTFSSWLRLQCHSRWRLHLCGASLGPHVSKHDALPSHDWHIDAHAVMEYPQPVGMTCDVVQGNTRGGVHVYEARDGSRIASMASDKVPLLQVAPACCLHLHVHVRRKHERLSKTKINPRPADRPGCTWDQMLAIDSLLVHIFPSNLRTIVRTMRRRPEQYMPAQVAAPVEACALSNDCRHLLAAAGKGFVFRYEHNPRHAAAAQVGWLSSTAGFVLREQLPQRDSGHQFERNSPPAVQY